MLSLRNFPVRPIVWVLLEQLVVSLLQEAIEGSEFRSYNCSVQDSSKI